MQTITKRFGKLFMAAIFGLAILTTNTAAATFTVTNTNDSGAGSLRQAVLDANAATATADTIVFDASFNVPRTITVATVISVSPAAGVDTLTITGPGANLLTISNNTTNRIFQNGVNDTTPDVLTISGITFAQSAAATLGAINNFATLTVNNCVFTGNYVTTARGRAIDNTVATSVLTVTGSAFNGNSDSSGGAISNDGTATITNSTFNSNVAVYGGAISSGGVLNVTGCTFTNNVSLDAGATGLGGGAIYSSSNLITANVIITGSTFTGNTVGGNQGGGGAVRNRFGSMTITNSNFTGNSAVPGGGAVHNTDVINISGCNFTNNSATGGGAFQSGAGGAISNQGGGQVTIANSVITGNSAVSSGGGIYYQPNAQASEFMTITNSTISNNISNSDSDRFGNGGGLYLTGRGLITITGSTISGNTVNAGTTDPILNGNGGGIYAETLIAMTNSTVSGNTAQRNIGGIYIYNINGGTVNFINSTIVANRAAGRNGGLLFDNSFSNVTVNLRNSIFANNTDDGTSPDLGNISGSIYNSQGYNLIENTTGATITGTTTGNITGVDPLLDYALRNNGGATQTHALRRGSPAIDAGDPTTFPATDQRGIARPQDGNGTSRADIGAYERRPSEIIGAATADFDGDGKADISVFRPSQSVWYVSKSSDNGSLTAQWGIATDKLVPGDYNGDEKTDYAVFRDGFWYILLNGGGFEGYQWGSTGDIPFPADFDGDGKTDLAVFRNGTWFVRRSAGGTTTQTFGSAGDIPVVADYDGDGKADFAVYRNGIWYVLKSTGGDTAVQWGIAGDKTVPGDYNGDGKADYAVFRNGFWYVLLNGGGFLGAQWGTTGDLASPADYDGDGKTDLAVFRAGTWYIQRTTAGVQIFNYGLSGDKPVANAFVP